VVPEGDLTPKGERPSLIERRVRRIVNARSATIGLAATFVGFAVIGAVVMRFADPDNFPSVALAIWWALQTVTTVGYGDVVPTTVAGRIVGGIVMVTGVAFIAFVTAGVTSTVLQRAEAEAKETDRARDEQRTEAMIDVLTQIREAVTEQGRRLDNIESKISS
jgi:voltage-gated potassium channel